MIFSRDGRSTESPSQIVVSHVKHFLSSPWKGLRADAESGISGGHNNEDGPTLLGFRQGIRNTIENCSLRRYSSDTCLHFCAMMFSSYLVIYFQVLCVIQRQCWNVVRDPGVVPWDGVVLSACLVHVCVSFPIVARTLAVGEGDRRDPTPPLSSSPSASWYDPSAVSLVWCFVSAIAHAILAGVSSRSDDPSPSSSPRNNATSTSWDEAVLFYYNMTKWSEPSSDGERLVVDLGNLSSIRSYHYLSFSLLNWGMCALFSTMVIIYVCRVKNNCNPVSMNGSLNKM